MSKLGLPENTVLLSRLSFTVFPQIMGGNGYNTEYPAEKLMRDAKIFQVRDRLQLIPQ